MNELVNEKLKRFIDLLKGIFELDKSDLDFGIYRIMNIRKNEIEKFLNEDLPKKVEETLAPFASKGKEELLKKILKNRLLIWVLKCQLFQNFWSCMNR